MSIAGGGAKHSSRALVLGGGGPVGRAWESGLVSGLIAKGVALRTADLILGTSAGAIVGAQLALGLDLSIAATVPGKVGAPVPFGGMSELVSLTAQAVRASAPATHRQAIGQLALKAATPSEEQSMQRVDILARHAWPANFRATAVDVRTGESVVWQADSGVPLERAVASSCALPGVWPPITIGSGRYMDGGIRSLLNADFARGHAAVIIVSCFTLVFPEGFGSEDQKALNASLHAEIATLRESGAHVDLITPSAEFSTLTGNGAGMLDTSLTPDAVQMGLRQASQEASGIHRIWYQN
jgi:NTE family protein